MVLSREVDSKVLRITIQFEYFFFSDKKAKMGKCNVKIFEGFPLV